VSINFKLRALRVGHGFYQKDMSALLGLKADGSYSQKESGKRAFTQREIQIISDKFDLDGEQIKSIFFNSELTSNDNVTPAVNE